MPHDGRRREPFATAHPQSFLSFTVDLLLMGRCFVNCVLTSLPIEEHHVGSKTAVDCGGAVARGSLRHPLWRISSLRAGKNQSLATLNMKAICPSETSVLTRVYISENIHHCYLRGILPDVSVLRPYITSFIFLLICRICSRWWLWQFLAARVPMLRAVVAVGRYCSPNPTQGHQCSSLAMWQDSLRDYTAFTCTWKVTWGKAASLWAPTSIHTWWGYMYFSTVTFLFLLWFNRP
jgi:hypothetical protein